MKITIAKILNKIIFPITMLLMMFSSCLIKKKFIEKIIMDKLGISTNAKPIFLKIGYNQKLVNIHFSTTQNKIASNIDKEKFIYVSIMSFEINPF